MPDIETIFVCEWASVGVENGITKTLLQGIAEEMRFEKLPSEKEEFYIVTEWRGKPNEKFILSTVFQNPLGEYKVVTDSEIIIRETGFTRNISGYRGMAIFTMVGNYRITFLTNEKPASRGVTITIHEGTFQ